MIRFGIDLGGTKIEISALSPDGRELLRRRIATPHENDRGIMDTMVMLVRFAEESLGASGTVGSARRRPRRCAGGRSKMALPHPAT